MDKRAAGIIGVIAAILLCAIPGLVTACLAVMAIYGGIAPDSGMPSDEVAVVIGCSIALIGLSLVFIAVPVLVWFFVLRDKSPEVEDLGVFYLI